MLYTILIPILSVLSVFDDFDPEHPLPANVQTSGDSYCYASWAPHGAFWQDICYPSKSYCNKSLKYHLDQGIPANTEKCYRLEYTDAYCLLVPSGYYRPTDDFEIVTPLYLNVCTKKYDDCAKYERFSITHDKCTLSRVKNREGEGLYLSSKNELEGIWTRNSELYKPTPFVKPIECTKYEPIPNQPLAFETLRLDWERTKKWGAFIDVYGNLRANKPSCRLIRPDSEEYSKYTKSDY